MRSLILFFRELTIVKKILLVLTPILTVMLNSQSAIIGLALLILLDLLSGIRKDFYLKGITAYIWQKSFWKGVKSYGIRETWKKTYEYGIGIIVCSIFESMIFKMEPIDVMNREFSLTELAIMIASIVEVYSNYENMEAVSGRNVFKLLTQFLPKPIQDVLSKLKNKK
jgi:hypothetical protein